MLQVKKLSKKFNKNEAVKNVSFEVKEGEIFSLIGPNGSGKTTIIKIIAGLLQPATGSVEVEGFDVTREPVRTKIATGYIPDEPAIWPAMTGEEFLHLSGALYHITEEECNKRIPNLLSVFNLGDIGRGYFEDYSRGNKQKFTILAALLHKPKLLLIDEPIVGLDPVSAEIAENLFSKFAQEGGSILLVTHTLSVAQKIAHRIGVLKKGKLFAAGSYEELCKQAKLGEEANLEDIYKALT